METSKTYPYFDLIEYFVPINGKLLLYYIYKFENKLTTFLRMDGKGKNFRDYFK